MATRERAIGSGFWTNSLGTLASRVLGLVRDMATAALLGLGSGSTMDAFVIAFRVPNLFRRIFGEGALAAAFLPEFSAQWEQEPRRAWQLLSALLWWLAVILSVVVLLGLIGCGLVYRHGGLDARDQQLVRLTAILLPYLIVICLAAQTAAALQALGQFRWPAIAPVLLNVCWLAAVWCFAPWWSSDQAAQAEIIAVAVLFSGVLQLGVQWPPLYRLGFRFDFDWRASRDAASRVVHAMWPITLGLAVTQLNTLMDSVIAWELSAESDSQHTIAWLGHAVAYPLERGATAAIYYGERFYQLPVGLLGIAIATTIYPLLARHAARGDRERIGQDLSLGLRLVLFTAVPASVGLILVAQPLTRLLFERGEFSADDAQRAGAMIACYASGVWAYCALPVLVRGYYAVGDRLTPARLGMVAVGINLVLNLTLIWAIAERGLAISTAVAAMVQAVLLAVVFSRRSSRLDWPALGRSSGKTVFATLVMVTAVLAVEQVLPASADASRLRQTAFLGLAIGVGVSVYLGTAWVLGCRELSHLFDPRIPRGQDGAE